MRNSSSYILVLSIDRTDFRAIEVLPNPGDEGSGI